MEDAGGRDDSEAKKLVPPGWEAAKVCIRSRNAKILFVLLLLLGFI